METPKHHHITIGMRIAVGLAFLPTLYFVLTLLVRQLPFPTILVNFQTGELAPYFLWMPNSPHNFFGAVIFSISSLIVGMLLILWFGISWTDIIRQITHDLFHNTTWNAPKETPTEQKPTPTDTTTERHWYSQISQSNCSHRVPETSP